MEKVVILESFFLNGLKSLPGTCECATASKEAVMSAIEKLCLSSSANDFHVSLDIIFWREGSFFNYAGASFAHYFPHNPWLMLEEEILLFYIHLVPA